MYFKQFYLGCLAHASYLLGSQGEAAVVDPQRDVEEYLREAEAQQLKIKYVIETHLHADFVSGHRELAERSGAEIVFGEKARVAFPHRPVSEGDEIKIGRVILSILETPGHTPESICVLVTDTETPEQPQKLLSGDTLFIGDVGRPDLAGGKGFTPQMMAEMMYDTLHNKLLRLPEETELYPAHGAGSMCGRNMSTETFSTIGEQKRVNYALKPMSKDEFVRMMTTDLPEAPIYFAKDAEINRTGAGALQSLERPVALAPAEVTKLPQGHVILDVRSAAEFGAGHVPGAINIGLNGQFAMWAGSLIPLNTPIVIVADSEQQVEEAVMRLARVGIESVIGYLDGSMLSWSDAGLDTATVPQITVDELKRLLDTQPQLQVIDVRRPPEYESGHVPRAVPAPLSILSEQISNLGLNTAKPTAVICAGGYRSSAATSILKRNGFGDLLNVAGGTAAWTSRGFPVEVSPAKEQRARG